jgi:hypothetical protein
MTYSGSASELQKQFEHLRAVMIRFDEPSSHVDNDKAPLNSPNGVLAEDVVVTQQVASDTSAAAQQPVAAGKRTVATIVD